MVAVMALGGLALVCGVVNEARVVMTRVAHMKKSMIIGDSQPTKPAWSSASRRCSTSRSDREGNSLYPNMLKSVVYCSMDGPT